jgi:hypothetical protein
MASQPLQLASYQRRGRDRRLARQEANLQMPTARAKAVQCRLHHGRGTERIHRHVGSTSGDLPYPIG